jgi:putative membrane protein
MDYAYLKALHIIFVVTWFAGMFYIPRLFIYATEANDKDSSARDVLQAQFGIMMSRLWYGITWPSAVLTLILGPWVLWKGGWWAAMWEGSALWLVIKVALVVILYGYHLYIHYMFTSIRAGHYKWSSDRLRIWNEGATVLLIAIVMLATVKTGISVVWGLVGLVVLMAALLAAIRIYKKLRSGN